MPLQRVQIPSPNHGGNRPRNQLLVVHTSEGATTFKSLGAFLANPSRKVSYHVGFDDTTSTAIGEFVKPPYRSWSAHQANSYGEHGCCCTPSGASKGWSRQQWLSRPRMLEACRQWLREEGARYGIPIIKLNPAQIRAGQKGVCGHADCVAAGLGGTHTDPGPNFPWDVVCKVSPGPVPPTPEPVPPPPHTWKGWEMFWIGTTDGKYHLLGPNFTNEIDSNQALQLAGMGMPNMQKQNPLVVISMMKAVGTWKD